MLLFRLLYNVTLYPLALLVWWLRRRLVLRRVRGATLHLTAMPAIAPGRRLRPRASLAGLAADLEVAAADPLVRGLFVRLDGFKASAVDYVELARLIDRFKRSGKLLHVFVERLDWRSLMAGRAADRLTTSPSGPVMIHGIGVDVPFVGELLDRCGVAVQSVQRGAYKGTMEPFVRREASPLFLETLQALVDSLFDRAAEELGKRAGWNAARARTALEEGPYTIGQAIDRKVVDAAAQPDEAEDHLAKACGDRPHRAAGGPRPRAPQKGARAGGGPLRHFPPLRRAGIVRPAPLALSRAPRLAFVPIAGLIIDRPLGAAAGQMAVATELAPRIRRLADARGVEAIVLVVDSRGGTAAASDVIWGAVRYALGRKPVVAWMHAYAASGGYYVSAAAERIIASPFTITGSIGVIASKPNVSRAAAQLGVRTVSVSRGRAAVLSSPFRPYSDSDMAWLEAYVDEAYRRFTSIVAEGRRMTLDDVEAVAGGRVWTGPEARERGLVDGIGAFPDVVDAARELAGIPAGRRHEILWSAPREGLVRIIRRLGRPTGSAHLATEVDRLLELMILAEQRQALYYMSLVWQ